MKLSILVLMAFPFLCFAQMKTPASVAERNAVLQSLSNPANIAGISLEGTLSSLDRMSSLERLKPEVYKYSSGNYQVVFVYRSWGPTPGVQIDVEDIYLMNGKAWVHNYKVDGFSEIQRLPGVGRGTR